MVLPSYWQPLWELGAEELPLAFQSFEGHEEAAATLLLNQVARNIFSLDATHLNDALTAFAISDRDFLRQIETRLAGDHGSASRRWKEWSWRRARYDCVN
ncbi:hypothetical protein [Kribbella endophytica]